MRGHESAIPRRLRMYWEGSTPELVAVLLLRTYRMHPEWDVEVLNEITEPIAGLSELSVQHRSDWVRMCEMQPGGVWLDATCVCSKPVDSWVDMHADAVQGFSAPFATDALENWAFAAPRSSPLMRRWKAVFRSAIEQGFDAFKANAPSFVRAHAIFDHLPYLTMHACYLIAARETGEVAHLTPSCSGPFAYLCDANWDTWRAVHALATAPMPHPPPLLKLRGAETHALHGHECCEGSFLHSVGVPARSSSFWLCATIVVAACALAALAGRRLGLEEHARRHG